MTAKKLKVWLNNKLNKRNKIVPYFHTCVIKYQNHFEFPKGGKWSPRLKILEIPGGRGVIIDPSGMENPGGWGVQIKESSMGGMDIFWNHTI